MEAAGSRLSPSGRYPKGSPADGVRQIGAALALAAWNSWPISARYRCVQLDTFTTTG